MGKNKSEVLVPVSQVRGFRTTLFLLAALIGAVVGWMIPLPEARACMVDGRLQPTFFERLKPMLDLRRAYSASEIFIRFSGTREELNKLLAGGRPVTTSVTGAEPVYTSVEAALSASTPTTQFIVGIDRRTGGVSQVVTVSGEELMLLYPKGGCGSASV